MGLLFAPGIKGYGMKKPEHGFPSGPPPLN
jgi:hypothetical protein